MEDFEEKEEGHWDIKVYDQNGEEIGAIDRDELSDETLLRLDEVAQRKYPDYEF